MLGFITNIDFSFIGQVGPLYAQAAIRTVLLAGAGIFLSLVIGLVCSLIHFYRVPVLKTMVGAYIELSRNTPLMIQLFFLYFGLPRVGLRLEGITCGIIGLAFLGGGYMAEAFRSGLEAVSRVQTEAGLSIGLSRPQLIRYVLMPQALAVAVPAVAANTILFNERNRGFQHCGSGRSGLRIQRLDQGGPQQREHVSAGHLLSDHNSACLPVLRAPGKEDAPCWIQRLVFSCRAGILPG